jgi:cobalamin biosynthetic protein CobC
MLIGHRIEAADAPSLHGGDLSAARELFPAAPEPFIDLSTGVNPFSYPIPGLSADDFVRLPDRARVRALAALAAQFYGAPSADGVVAAPGTQILLPMVGRLVRPGRAMVLGPTYAEHARAAALAGHATAEVASVEQLRRADLGVVVNPNNPDGRIASRSDLLDVADDLRRRGGILVVDEAFADVVPSDISLAGDAGRGGIVVLRSFGKFFGVAGVRLGFALTSPLLAQRLDAMLGPWPVSGPAIAIAETALSEPAWSRRTLTRLARSAARLDQVLRTANLQIVGGTPLFRLTESAGADELFGRLGRAGILVRRFDVNQAWLRWGIPPDDAAWRRLEAVLFAN